jgi:hypothetical protein
MSALRPTNTCSIYVGGVDDRIAVVRLVESAVNGTSSKTLVTSPEGVEIDITTNEHNPKFEAVPPAESDFLFWPYIIDLDVDEKRGVLLVTSILRKLWSEGLSAVAACSFEERLPRSGGYRAGQLVLTDE